MKHKDEAAVCLLLTLSPVSAASPPYFPGWIEARLLRKGFTPIFYPRAWPGQPFCNRCLPLGTLTTRSGGVVSQVLLILIGSGMTYCWGEGDCHGPTGMGAGGIDG